MFGFLTAGKFGKPASHPAPALSLGEHMSNKQEPMPKYRLLKDLYVFHNPDVNKDVAYRLFTLDELKEIVSVSYPAGTIWEYDAKNGYMSNPDHGEIGIKLTGPEPAWWEPYSEQDFPCGPNVAYEIFAPNGTPIVGTLELLKGVAGVT